MKIPNFNFDRKTEIDSVVALVVSAKKRFVSRKTSKRFPWWRLLNSDLLMISHVFLSSNGGLPWTLKLLLKCRGRLLFWWRRGDGRQNDCGQNRQNVYFNFIQEFLLLPDTRRNWCTARCFTLLRQGKACTQNFIKLPNRLDCNRVKNMNQGWKYRLWRKGWKNVPVSYWSSVMQMP